MKSGKTVAALLATALLILGSSTVAAATAKCSKLIASGNPEYPPFLWQSPGNDSVLIGANAELMQLLSKEIGIPIETRYVGPWGRVQETARVGRIDLIAGAFLTQPRLQYLRYINPPIHDTQSLVWVGQNSKIDYRGWHDLIGLEGITVVNNSFGQAFDQFAAHNLKIQQVGSVRNAMKMLQLGRADYLIYEDAPGYAYAASMGINNIKTISAPVSSEKLYLTMSLNSGCNQDQLSQQITLAMKKLTEQNVMATLLPKYIQLWQQQSRERSR